MSAAKAKRLTDREVGLRIIAMTLGERNPPRPPRKLTGPEYRKWAREEVEKRYGSA
jgi:hypothetical protein